MALATAGEREIDSLNDFERLLRSKRTENDTKPQSADRALADAWRVFCEQPHVVAKAGDELSPYSTVYAAALVAEEADAKTVHFMEWVRASIGKLDVPRSSGRGLVLEKPAQYHRDWFKNIEDVRCREFRGRSRKLTATDTRAKDEINKAARKRSAAHQATAKVKKPFAPGDKALMPGELKRILRLVSRSGRIKDLCAGAALAYQVYTGRRAAETFTLQLDRVHRMGNGRYKHALDELKGPDQHDLTYLWFTHWTGKGTQNVRYTAGVFEHRDATVCGLFMLGMYILVRSEVERGWTRKWEGESNGGPEAALLFEVPLQGSRLADELRKDQGDTVNRLLSGINKLSSTHLGHATVQQMGNQLGINALEIAAIANHRSTMTAHYVGQDINHVAARAKLCGHSGEAIVCPRARVSERKRPGELTHWVSSKLELKDDDLKQALAGVLLSALPLWPDDGFMQWTVVRDLKRHPSWPSHRAEVLAAQQQLAAPSPIATATPSPDASQRSTGLRQIPADFKLRIVRPADVWMQLHDYRFDFCGTMEQHLQRRPEGDVD